MAKTWVLKEKQWGEHNSCLWIHWKGVPQQWHQSEKSNSPTQKSACPHGSVVGMMDAVSWRKLVIFFFVLIMAAQPLAMSSGLQDSLQVWKFLGEQWQCWIGHQIPVHRARLWWHRARLLVWGLGQGWHQASRAHMQGAGLGVGSARLLGHNPGAQEWERVITGSRAQSWAQAQGETVPSSRVWCWGMGPNLACRPVLCHSSGPKLEHHWWWSMWAVTARATYFTHCCLNWTRIHPTLYEVSLEKGLVLLWWNIIGNWGGSAILHFAQLGRIGHPPRKSLIVTMLTSSRSREIVRQLHRLSP